MPYGLFCTSYSHISVAITVGAKRVPLATAPHKPAQYSHSVKLTLHFYVHIVACPLLIKIIDSAHLFCYGMDTTNSCEGVLFYPYTTFALYMGFFMGKSIIKQRRY